MKLEQAKNLKSGDILLYALAKNADGTSQRWKVTSVKTWKSAKNSHRIEIGLKRGLYQYAKIDENELDNFEKETSY